MYSSPVVSSTKNANSHTQLARVPCASHHASTAASIRNEQPTMNAPNAILSSQGVSTPRRASLAQRATSGGVNANTTSELIAWNQVIGMTQLPNWRSTPWSVSTRWPGW